MCVPSCWNGGTCLFLFHQRREVRHEYSALHAVDELNHEFAQCHKYVLGATAPSIESHAARTPFGLSPVAGRQLRRVEHEDFVADLDHEPRVAAARSVPDRPVALAVGPVRELDGGGDFDGEGVEAFQFDPAGERAVVGAGCGPDADVQVRGVFFFTRFSTRSSSAQWPTLRTSQS